MRHGRGCSVTWRHYVTSSCHDDTMLPSLTPCSHWHECEFLLMSWQVLIPDSSAWVERSQSLVQAQKAYCLTAEQGVYRQSISSKNDWTLYEKQIIFPPTTSSTVLLCMHPNKVQSRKFLSQKCIIACRHYVNLILLFTRDSRNCYSAS